MKTKTFSRLSLGLLLALISSTSLSLAQADLEGKIHRLPETRAAKTISLNPEYYVFGERLAKGEQKLPLLIVLHGGGGTGLNIEKCKGQASRLIRTIDQTDIKSLVVAPQASLSPMKVGAKGGWVPADLNILLAHLLETLPVDPNRVYLTGSSMGGYGTYAWAGVNPEHFAAIAPMVGGLGALGPKDITPDLDLWGKNIAKLPMRAYYGAMDKVVPADRGEMILKAIEKAEGKQADVIVFEDMGHNAGQRPFSDPKFFQWLFSHRRGE
jgi:predicted peptidase